MINQLDNKYQKINHFTDLISWKKSHSFVLNIYLITKKFPKEETYGLTNQIRRSAISISSNIAEGFSRTHSKEKIQFYRTSLGSLTEVQNQLIIAKDLQYMPISEFTTLFEHSTEVSKLICGLIKGVSKLN